MRNARLRTEPSIYYYHKQKSLEGAEEELSLDFYQTSYAQAAHRKKKPTDRERKNV